MDSQEPEHVKDWNTWKSVNVDEMFSRYRPKEIRRYEENGHIVRVFESRIAGNYYL